MRLGSKVNHAVKVLFREKPFKKRGIPYVSMDKAMPFRLGRGKVIQIGKITGIGQCIQIYDTPVRLDGKGIFDEICANETGSTCDQ